MNGKFTTTSSSLFNNEIKADIPDWMKGLDLEVEEVKPLDLDIQTKGIFAEKTTINRKEGQAFSRELVANFNETKLVTDAKIELAKFLSGRYYKIDCNVFPNHVKLATKVDGIPSTFNFIYEVQNGKLKGARTFIAMVNDSECEYPFSKAGFEECLLDIKNNRVKTSKKVEAVGKYSIINREEIIRRYNGKLREATDKINELLAEGSIVGVGSNSYASFYDVEYLFPAQEKEKGMEKMSEFEFAPNTEHVATNEYKSSKQLTIESSKLLSEFFDDFEIISGDRDEDELLVSATILAPNGIRHTAHFSFGIENEKVVSLKVVEQNDCRMTLQQFLEKININKNILNEYLKNTKTAKRIYKGIVLTRKNINHQLSKIVASETINAVIDNWVGSGMITPVNSTTFTTTHSFNELLGGINVKLLTDEEINNINALSNKVANLATDRQDVKDTGIREYEVIEGSNDIRLSNLQHTLACKFKHFNLSKFSKLKNDIYICDMKFVNPTNGSINKIALKCSFNINQPDQIIAIIKNKQFTLDKVASSFEKSEVLSLYLNDNNVTSSTSSIILSKNQIKNKLEAYCSNNEIEKIVNEWIENGLLKEIGNEKYASKITFDQLLNRSNIEVLSEQDRKEILIAKQFFGNSFNREAIKDTGVRIAQEKVTDDTILNNASAYLAKLFDNFNIKDFSLNNETLNYTVELFDKETGLKTNIVIYFQLDGNKITNAYADLNNEKVKLSNIKKAFSTNEVLKKYLATHTRNRVDAPMIITSTKLHEKLKSICNLNSMELENVMDSWCHKGKLNKIGINVYASKYTLEQLIAESNLRPLSDDEIKQKLQKSKRDTMLKISSAHIQDNDTRELIETWTPERMLLEAKAKLSKYFKHYDIVNAELDNDTYKLEVKALNPKNGIRSNFKCSFKLENNKFSKLESIRTNTIASKEVIALLQYRNVTDNLYNTNISKTTFKNVLSKVMDNSNIDNAIDFLIKKSMLTPISANNFTSELTMTELVDYLAKNKITDLEKAREQQMLAMRNENKMEISDHRQMDSDSRVLEAKEKQLSPKMIELKGKIYRMANAAYQGKLITSNKFSNIKLMLENAVEEKDLEIASKELRKYLV